LAWMLAMVVPAGNVGGAVVVVMLLGVVVAFLELLPQAAAMRLAAMITTGTVHTRRLRITHSS